MALPIAFASAGAETICGSTTEKPFGSGGKGEPSAGGAYAEQQHGQPDPRGLPKA
jgi:hypothetical protein